MSDTKIVRNSGKRKPPAAGKGRPKGASNKVTKTIREAIETSFEQVGGADYLAKMAQDHPTAYMSLLSKILPAHMNVTHKDATFRLVVERASAKNNPSTD